MSGGHLPPAPSTLYTEILPGKCADFTVGRVLFVAFT